MEKGCFTCNPLRDNFCILSIKILTIDSHPLLLFENESNRTAGLSKPIVPCPFRNEILLNEGDDLLCSVGHGISRYDVKTGLSQNLLAEVYVRPFQAYNKRTS